MSFEATAAVWTDKRLKTPGQLTVMLALANYAGPDGWCWPAVDTIAEMARYGYRRTFDLLCWLEDHEFIQVVPRGGWNGSNLYGINAICKGRFDPPGIDEIREAMATKRRKKTTLQRLHSTAKIAAANEVHEIADKPVLTNVVVLKEIACTEFPTEEQVTQFGEAYAGNLARGIPPKIPLQWLRKYWAWSTFKRRQWSQDWQRELIWRFETAWQDGYPEARGTVDQTSSMYPGPQTEKKNAGVWSLKQKLEILKTREQNHEANEDSSAYLGEPPIELLKDLEQLRQEIAEVQKQMQTA